MQIEFTLKIDNRNEYFVTRNNQLLFHAVYNKKFETKELYNENRMMIARSFPFYTKKIQFIPPHMFQFFVDNTVEIIVRNKPLLSSQFYFTYQGDRYKLIKHLGTKSSIFKNDRQIAAYNAWGNKSNSGRGSMTLLCDDNVNIPILCLASLHLYSSFAFESADSGNPVFNLGLFSKRSNSSWKPNL